MKSMRIIITMVAVAVATSVGHMAEAARRAAIERAPRLNGWALQTPFSTYLIARKADGTLQHVYWGGPLADVAHLTAKDFPVAFGTTLASGGYPGVRNEEYPAWRGLLLEEPCLKVTSANGVRDLLLRYVSDEISGDELALKLKDVDQDIFVTLRYRVYKESGIIEKNATVTNSTSSAITVESLQSGVWDLPPDIDYRLTYLAGHWGAEAHVIQETVHPGLRQIESRNGRTGFESNPWFAIDAGGRATEESGRVWFGALGWSGSWRIAVERTPNAQVRVTGGMNPFDFAYVLKPSESLESPPFYGGYTTAGFGDASRRMHDFERTQIVPHGRQARLRPVWFNSYQIYGRNVSESNQMALAKQAAAVGVELFLVDAGWYSTNGDVNAGLGDWIVDRQKFPRGLKALSDYVNSLGMDFGLWVEPETINPRSDLYRAHPDWVLNFPGRTLISHGGGQRLPLNLARDDVADYLVATLDRLVTECGVRLFKWDMNFLVGAPGWPGVAPAEQQQLWVKYTRNLYAIIDRVRAKHPQLEFESCAGGGSRIDMGILKRVDQFWTSDNTDALDRIGIQQGFSFAYSPRFTMGRVPPPASASGEPNVRPDTPLDFRFVVAMTQSLGLSLDLTKLTNEETARVRELVAFYKSIRPTVQDGQHFRLTGAAEEGLVANQYIATDGRQSVVFVAQRSREFFSVFRQPIYLRGIRPDARYRVQVLHPGKMLEQTSEISGAVLMNHGLHFKFPNPSLDGTVIVLNRKDS